MFVKIRAFRQIDHPRIYFYHLTDLKDEHIQAVDWTKSRHMTELDVSCTDLSENCLLDVLLKLPPLTYLAVAYCDFFTDNVRNLNLN